MRGAFLLSDDPQLFAKVCRLLVDRGGFCSEPGRVAQIDVDDFLFNFFGYDPGDDVREPPFEAAPGVVMPDMATVRIYSVECRSAKLVADLTRAIAAVADGPMWILDANDVIWDAETVDPERLAL